ncbi:MAG: polyphosphate polymerase domain-containing protein [Peptococcaceae bacterium]|nr:polyphosphate polymerase domain-containing protein [Peptococcaceae bacterium]
MKNNGTFRHELKYQIPYGDYLAIRQRIRPVMKLDKFAGSTGSYVIRSIYFDNLYDKALREKVNGVQKREKFRIRYYNDDFSFIVLEKKIKINNLSMKVDARLSEAECRALLDGETDWMLEHPGKLVQELYCKLHTQQLRPKVLVSYVREPFTYGPGNVRVTFDSHLRSTLFHRDFLEEKVSDILVNDNPSDVILEVKYDAFLPDIIQDLLQTSGIRQRAFSKYCACRRFG